jgi:hypothetical protein
VEINFNSFRKRIKKSLQAGFIRGGFPARPLADKLYPKRPWPTQ